MLAFFYDDNNKNSSYKTACQNCGLTYDISLNKNKDSFFINPHFDIQVKCPYCENLTLNKKFCLENLLYETNEIIHKKSNKSEIITADSLSHLLNFKCNNNECGKEFSKYIYFGYGFKE